MMLRRKLRPGSALEPIGLEISGSHPTICKHLDTLALKFSGGEMEINKSSIGQTNHGDSPVKPETFDNHQLICRDFCCNVSSARTPGTFCTIFLILFCHSICNDDGTNPTMHVFTQEQCEDEINIVPVDLRDISEPTGAVRCHPPLLDSGLHQRQIRS